jgi:hypothetical protein
MGFCTRYINFSIVFVLMILKLYVFTKTWPNDSFRNLSLFPENYFDFRAEVILILGWWLSECNSPLVLLV